MPQRRLTRLLIPFALAVFASAQTTTTTRATTTSASITKAPSSTASSYASSSRAPQTFTVDVGPGDFIYKPDRIEDVHVNDTVLFQFFPPDHSVARAEYLNPCVPYESTGAGKTGFYSGVQYVDTVEHITNWTLLINDTSPIFFYCTAKGSCIDHQMVGVINPNATQTLNAQKAAAKNAKFMVAPGDDFPSEASSTLAFTTGVATGQATSAPASSHHGTHLSGGAIAGIVVGAVAFLVICAALFFFVGRTKSLKEVIARRDATVSKTTPQTPGTEYAGTPGSPGYPSPFSPSHGQAEAGFGGALPVYGQHHVAERHPTGWHSPHASMTTPPPQMTEYKPPGQQNAYHPAEMASPGHGQTNYTAELEAPIKGARY
ncbi:hypothetical protein BDV96DRAFT_596685 [Lophiotrema nucula]|uniref:Cupredoxin n=1 Tax=Lophiotrema nucula TaxID=690887 RepID=A0A6A5ZKU1_9PLEO|nr:hypothetical protein BDV96DRAFT_596685 [Lophiotrema nucula]